MKARYLAAVDLGAGSGAKTGIFALPAKGAPLGRPLVTGLLPIQEYGETAEVLAANLARILRADAAQLGGGELAAAGIASAGLFRSDGSYLLATNIEFLLEGNLKDLLAKQLDVPAGIENDANAGGLAEWSVARRELLYWVFGGGWGGAWIAADGRVRFPTLDWDRRDESLHYSDEPGYATPLEKGQVRALLAQEGLPAKAFESLCRQADGTMATGPSGKAETLRAEYLLSGPGRSRLFRACCEDPQACRGLLSEEEWNALVTLPDAGAVITRLCDRGFAPALKTDELFGKVLALAARRIFEQGRKDEMPLDVPIYAAGGPTAALKYWGPAAVKAWRGDGYRSALARSVIEERRENPNLIGAAELARRLASR
jgi:hypothetical protein